MKKFFSMLLAIVIVFSMLPPATLAAEETDAVSYQVPVYRTVGDPTSGIKEWKTEKCESYTLITNASTVLDGAVKDGWYVVSGEVTTGALTVKGAVHIILKDGAHLTANGTGGAAGIEAATGTSLTIYSQSFDEKKMGMLTATAKALKQGSNGAGIGGSGTNPNSGVITINGGKVTAESTYEIVLAPGFDYRSAYLGAGIGGGAGGNGSNITINGGRVEAGSRLTTETDMPYRTGNHTIDCSYLGAGIGGGSGGNGSDITINGGTVTAESYSNLPLVL